MAVKSERFLSFTRVLVLGYLLICKPSLSVALPEECKDLASSVLRHGADFTNVKVWTKLALCLTTFHEQNPMLAEKLNKMVLDDPTRAGPLPQHLKFIKDYRETLRIIEENIDPAKAGPFVALVLSIYLTKDALDMYYKGLPQHLEFIKDYRETLRIILEEKIEPLLKDINEVRYNWEEFHLAKIYKLLMERLEKIHNTIKDMLLKAKAEKVKLKGNEGDAIFMGIISVTVVGLAVVIAFTFAPSAVAFISACAAAAIGSGGVVSLYNSWSESIKMAKELEELQDETYKYKRKVVAGESRVNRLLIKVYRTGSQKAVGG